MISSTPNQTLGVATEIMGIRPEGWTAIEQMQKAR
jgi:methylmalonyl-CoA/ethylmalonyl-CoA epimerase